MAGDRHRYRFGPYELDTAHRILMRGRDVISLPAGQFEALTLFAANPKRVVTKHTLAEVAWKGTFVSDNSVVQMVRGLRTAIGKEYIQTVGKRGYQFDVDVTRDDAKASLVDVQQLLAPHRAFVEGRALVETFDLRDISRAGQVFESGMVAAPDYVDALIGLANVLVLEFQATREDAEPAIDRLARAQELARRACERAPSNGEALATFGFIQFLQGDAVGAIGTLNRAIQGEPDAWVHSLRLAYVSWGQARRHAAARVLRECPGLALACWLSATVLIARRAYDSALDVLRDGCAAQDRQMKPKGRFGAVGVHLLRALVLAALQRCDEALVELGRELALADDHHVYGRECRSNTWYAIGALLLRTGKRDDAVAAFRQALAAIPGHRCAVLGLACATGSLTADDARIEIRTARDALAKAVALALLDRHAAAAACVAGAIATAPAGPAGWQVPVEPLLNVSARPDEWAGVLSLLHDRAL